MVNWDQYLAKIEVDGWELDAGEEINKEARANL